MDLFPFSQQIQMNRRVGGLLCSKSNLLQRKQSLIVLGTPVLIFARAQHSPPPKREPRPRQPRVTVEEQQQPTKQEEWRPTSVQESLDETSKKQQYEQQQQQQQQQWEDISQQTTADALFVFLYFI
jgi:hypothetical protein